MRKANRDLRRLSRHQRREIGLATMLLCVVIVFLVCNVLPLVSNVWENVYVNPPNWIIELGNLLVTFNSGVNFVIYVIFGRKFKRIFLKLFCPASRDGLDCLGRPSRADSPDFQTNDDSVATNMSNIELRNSIRRAHSHHGSNSLRPSSNGYRASGGSVYYPSLPVAKTNSFNNGNHHHRPRANTLDAAVFC